MNPIARLARAAGMQLVRTVVNRILNSMEPEHIPVSVTVIAVGPDNTATAYSATLENTDQITRAIIPDITAFAYSSEHDPRIIHLDIPDTPEGM